MFISSIYSIRIMFCLGKTILNIVLCFSVHLFGRILGQIGLVGI